MIKIININNKAMALYAGMALFSMAWAAPAQNGQRPELAPQVLKQIQALQEEKAGRTPSQRKISSHLLYALKMRRGEAIAGGLPALSSSINVGAEGMVLLDIKARVTDAVLHKIKALSGEVLSSFPQYQAIRARLPLTRIESLASLPDVKSIRPADEATTNKYESTPSPAPPRRDNGSFLSPHVNPNQAAHTADVRARLRATLPRLVQAQRNTVAETPITNVVNVSQGDTAHRADLARSTFGVTGTGMRVGVLSNGVSSLATRQASGDLPPVVTVLPGQAGSGDEGTAILEIVHDLAPGTELYFATALGGQATFAQNILNLRAAGCNIIVDDVFYFTEPVFQDGIIAQSINTVTAGGGALYFSSAGNSGNKNDGTSGVWEGDFVAIGAPATGSLVGKTAHDFGGGVNSNQITADSPASFVLQWSDATGASANDYDLYLLDAALTTILAASTDIQDGNDDPYESISSSGFNDVNNRLVIVQSSGAARYLHLNANRGRLAVNTTGQTSGHSSAVNAFSVAAVNVATAGGGDFTGGSANPVETYSSDGLRRIFYSSAGTPITPGNFSATGGVIRQKPDVAAADCVATSTPGFNTFCGTSAAAPHAAAISALMLEANPALAATGFRSVYNASALDIEAPGVDRDSGVGIIDAFVAVNNSLRTDLSVSQTDSPDPVNTGANLSYSITVSNNGPSKASGVTVTDTLPAGVTFVSATPSQGNCNGTATITCNIGALNSTATITIIVKPTSAGSLSNTVSVSGAETDPSPFNNSATVTTTVNPAIDLALSKTDSPDPVIIGNNLTYTINVTNSGSISATGVTVTDTLPAGVTLVSASASQGTCSGTATITCTLGTLNAAASAGVTIVVKPTAAGLLTNSASVSAVETDSNSANNSASATTTVNPSVDLVLTKTDSPDPVTAGNNLTYAINVSNNGASSATGVTVTDTLPAGVTLVSASTSQGICSGTATITCTLGTLNATANAGVTIVVKPTAAGLLTNSASVSAVETDLNSTNNSATANTTVNPPLTPVVADLSITKADSVDPVIAGDMLSYTITVKNNGPDMVSNVIVTDTLAPGVTFVQATSGQGACNGTATITCQIGSLNSGANTNVTVFVIPMVAGPLSNTASVSGAGNDPNSANNQDTESTVVNPRLCNGLAATIIGTAGNDTLNGTAGPDVIAGLGGNDVINGLGGNDIICAGLGNDTVSGGEGNDLLRGEGGKDVLNGGLGRDRLEGGAGNDQLNGGFQTDTCIGGPGTDTATTCENISSVP